MASKSMLNTNRLGRPRQSAATQSTGEVGSLAPQPSRRQQVLTPGTSSAEIRVREVASRRDRQAFIDLPWRIYRDDPHWVPPLKREVAYFIDPRRHPFFQHGEAAFFVAWRQGQPVGRLSVSDDPTCPAARSENLGCFGMFECLPDQEVANQLLASARGWLASRGRALMRGPIDYSMNYPCGLLIDGFETPPRILMNHQRAYYQDLLENAGLVKAKDLYAWWLDDTSYLHGLAPRLERLAQRYKIKVRSVDPSDWPDEMQRCRDIYSSAWEDAWQSVPLSDGEFVDLAKNLRRISRPEFTLLAEVNGQPVGVVMLLPDVNEAIAPLNGRLTTWGLPIGAARLLWRLPRVSTGRLAILGVEEGFRRRGVAEMLILQVTRNAAAVNICQAEMGWTLEDNALVNNLIQRIGGQRYKTYRIYEQPINPVIPVKTGIQ